MKDFSVVIPVYQEAAHLEDFLATFLGGLSQAGLMSRCREICLVENGSTDGSADVCRRLAAAHTVVKCAFLAERSYGEALRSGIRTVAGDYLIILECDCLDVDFVKHALSLLDSDAADLVVGSKQLAAFKGRRPLLRGMLTLLMNATLRIFTGYRGTDTRGLKAGKISLFKELERAATTSGEAFQTEIVLLAWKMQKRIAEAAVPAEEKRPARTSVFRRSLAMVPEFFRLRKSLRRAGSPEAKGQPARGRQSQGRSGIRPAAKTS
jgi:glycosyltransferase involved in cell wall biosynthesis